MNVYKVGADLAYGVFTYTGDEKDENDYAEWERRYEAAGKPSAANWNPPHLESPCGVGKVLPVDCVASATFGGQSMLLNECAREALAPLLLPCGEYLPVEVDGLDYHWFNCTTLVDIADQDLIEGERSMEVGMLRWDADGPARLSAGVVRLCHSGTVPWPHRGAGPGCRARR